MSDSRRTPVSDEKLRVLAPADQKLEYSSPKLTHFGSVRELTMNGNGSGTDGGTTAGMTMMSDPTTKENVVRVGHHRLGFGLYVFNYKVAYRDACGDGRQFGVMADEVAAVLPEAVSRNADGVLQVNYALLGILPAGSA